MGMLMERLGISQHCQEDQAIDVLDMTTMKIHMVILHYINNQMRIT